MNSTIFRVQNASGEGPYIAAWGEFSFHPAHNDDPAGHPPPVLDTGIERWMNGNERCGFFDENQLAEWFTAENILEMCSQGFRIEKIDNVEITGFGRKQVLFRKAG